MWCKSIERQKKGSPDLERAMQHTNAASNATSCPFLLMMDSLAAHDVTETCDCVRAWLASEFAARHPQSPNPVPHDTLTNHKLLPHFNVEVPRQLNSFDCGVFVICYAEMVLQAVQHDRIEAPFIKAGPDSDVNILGLLPEMLSYTFGRGTFKAEHVKRVRSRLVVMLKRLQLKNAVLVYSVPHQAGDAEDLQVQALSDDIKLPPPKSAVEFAQLGPRASAGGSSRAAAARSPYFSAAAVASSKHIAAMTASPAHRGAVRRIAGSTIPLRQTAPQHRTLASPPKDLATRALPPESTETAVGAASESQDKLLASAAVADIEEISSSGESTGAVEAGGGDAAAAVAASGAAGVSDGASSSDEEEEFAEHLPAPATVKDRPPAKRPREQSTVRSPLLALQHFGSSLMSTLGLGGSSSAPASPAAEEVVGGSDKSPRSPHRHKSSKKKKKKSSHKQRRTE